MKHFCIRCGGEYEVRVDSRLDPGDEENPPFLYHEMGVMCRKCEVGKAYCFSRMGESALERAVVLAVEDCDSVKL